MEAKTPSPQSSWSKIKTLKPSMKDQKSTEAELLLGANQYPR